MSEGLEKLRSIGAQKIHEQTHIAQRYVQALLHESFEGMQKVQLLGFISILEREYDVDLQPVKESALAYFETLKEEKQNGVEPSYKQELFTKSNDEKKRFYLIGLLFVVLIVAIVLYFGLRSDETQTAKRDVNTSISKLPEESSLPYEKGMNVRYIQDKESNASDEENKSALGEKEVALPDESGSAKEIEKPKPHSLSILPKTKVWVGIIDLDTGKKRQKISAQPIELNASKSYLLTFGHGYIDMELDGNKTTYKEPKAIKFLYKEGSLKKINDKEFRKYNKGKLW